MTYRIGHGAIYVDGIEHSIDLEHRGLSWQEARGALVLIARKYYFGDPGKEGAWPLVQDHNRQGIHATIHFLEKMGEGTTGTFITEPGVYLFWLEVDKVD